MLGPRPLRRAERLRDVAEGVEDRLRPATRLVGGGELRDPGRRRVVADREAARDCGGLRDEGGDDVHVGVDRVGSVPARGEQRLVVGGSGARAVGVVLRRPEGLVVRIVPDHDVLDLRVDRDHVGHVATELPARLVCARRVLGAAVERDDDPQPGDLADDPVDRVLEVRRHLRLARMPLARDADRLQPERPRVRGGLLRAAPDERILVGADDHPGAGERRRSLKGDEERADDRREEQPSPGEPHCSSSSAGWPKPQGDPSIAPNRSPGLLKNAAQPRRVGAS